jgi:ABC-type phosphonate transport system ATPase subunit
MSYDSPKYGKVPNTEFRVAMKDIARFNLVDDWLEEVRGRMRGLDKVLLDIAREVVLESRLEYVPVRTGRLRSSIMAYVINSGSVNIVAQTPYAAIVHETHKTKSKYLETPFMQMVDSGIIEDRLTRYILGDF